MSDDRWLDDTQASYDTVASNYTEMIGGILANLPYDRAVLGVFAELVTKLGGAVIDVGCGPGRIAAHLRGLGLDAFGLDLSPAMIEIARRDHPGVRFDLGSMTSLSAENGSLAGVLAWYSVIHVPDDVLPSVFAEFRRVLMPGGVVLLGFHVGDEDRFKTEGYGGLPMSLHVYLRTPERVEELLQAAGFTVEARLVREPDRGMNTVPQGYVLARLVADAQVGQV